MAQTSPIRVAVIADAPQARARLQALVDATPALVFAGSAADSDSLARCLAGSLPDVLVIDLEPEAAEALGAGFDADHAPPALVLLSDEADGDWSHEALQGNVMAILSRDATHSEIAAAIEASAAGLCVLPPEMFARLLAGNKPSRSMESAVYVEALTPREIEVLTMLAEGLGNKDIARQLVISENTVKFHLSSIFGKLGATSRTEAVMLGMRQGFIMV
ncbi:MAG TPA: response regulator transcription factor [Paraburkholderia sp.]